MRVFGNLTNRIAETIKPPIPEVGMGATILYHSDREPATVIEIQRKTNPRWIVIQEDKATRTDQNGYSESQNYSYEPNPEGQKHTASLRANGTWVLTGGTMRTGTIVRLGERDKYYDYSF